MLRSKTVAMKLWFRQEPVHAQFVLAVNFRLQRVRHICLRSAVAREESQGAFQSFALALKISAFAGTFTGLAYPVYYGCPPPLTSLLLYPQFGRGL